MLNFIQTISVHLIPLNICVCNLKLIILVKAVGIIILIHDHAEKGKCLPFIERYWGVLTVLQANGLSSHACTGTLEIRLFFHRKLLAESKTDACREQSPCFIEGEEADDGGDYDDGGRGDGG